MIYVRVVEEEYLVAGFFGELQIQCFVDANNKVVEDGNNYVYNDSIAN